MCVLVHLQGNNWVRLRVQQMEPDSNRIGDNLEEAIELRREHAELCANMSVSVTNRPCVSVTNE